MIAREVGALIRKEATKNKPSTEQGRQEAIKLELGTCSVQKPEGLVIRGETLATKELRQTPQQEIAQIP